MTQVTRRTFLSTSLSAAGVGVAASVAGRVGPPVSAASLAVRPLGKTGAALSVVGFGGGARFYEPVPSDEAGADLVRTAIDHGMTLIETSTAYGPPGDRGRSERRVGLAMRTHRNRVFLETKVDQRDYDGAMREIEASLKRLNTDHIDLLLHHNLGRPSESRGGCGGWRRRKGHPEDGRSEGGTLSGLFLPRPRRHAVGDRPPRARCRPVAD